MKGQLALVETIHVPRVLLRGHTNAVAELVLSQENCRQDHYVVAQHVVQQPVGWTWIAGSRRCYRMSLLQRLTLRRIDH